MNTIEMNEFIDFTQLFVKLYEEHKEELEHHKFEADHFKRLIQFYDEGGLSAFDLQKDECELTDKYIHFVFGMDLEQANESTNYVATANYFIVYDRILNEFTSCDYEQG